MRRRRSFFNNFLKTSLFALLFCDLSPAYSHDLSRTPSLSTTRYGQSMATNTDTSVIRVFGNRWAIVIGINDFPEPSWRFKYANKDAKDFGKYLIDRAHFPAQNVRAVIGKRATKSNILSAVEWCNSVAKSDDLVIVFIRTRGVLNEKAAGFLATADTNPKSLQDTALSMQLFAKRIINNNQARSIVVITDADYSGNVYWSVFPGAYGLSLQEYQSCALICSTEGNQISWESPKYKNSVFTGSLLRLLRKSDSKIPIAVAAMRTNSIVNTEVHRIKPFRTQSVNAIGFAGAHRQDIVITHEAVSPRVSAR